ncbi:MAG TPA: hypothetical protein VH277_14215 [Gemmatimonadaceae bacterium]|jgi:hypothetical protein|nr:hypothetical protein [Gemmatimonadaceae bacterium]
MRAPKAAVVPARTNALPPVPDPLPAIGWPHPARTSNPATSPGAVEWVVGSVEHDHDLMPRRADFIPPLDDFRCSAALFLASAKTSVQWNEFFERPNVATHPPFGQSLATSPSRAPSSAPLGMIRALERRPSRRLRMRSAVPLTMPDGIRRPPRDLASRGPIDGERYTCSDDRFPGDARQPQPGIGR